MYTVQDKDGPFIYVYCTRKGRVYPCTVYRIRTGLAPGPRMNWREDCMRRFVLREDGSIETKEPEINPNFKLITRL